jgi:hypothetical protein
MTILRFSAENISQAREYLSRLSSSSQNGDSAIVTYPNGIKEVYAFVGTRLTASGQNEEWRFLSAKKGSGG